MLLPASCACPPGVAWEAATLLPSRSCFSLFCRAAGGRGDEETPAGRLEAGHTCVAHTHAARMHVTHIRTLHIPSPLPLLMVTTGQPGDWHLAGKFLGREEERVKPGSVARLCLHQSLHWCSCEPKCARLLRQISPGRAPSSSPFHLFCGGFFCTGSLP